MVSIPILVDTDDNINAMETPAHSQESTPESAALSCHVCNLSFRSTQEKRQHAKSEWHVYKIRCRVADSQESVVTPPLLVESVLSTTSLSSHRLKPPRMNSPQRIESKHRNQDQDEDEDEDEDADEYDEDESTDSDEPFSRPIVAFDPQKCLFCPLTNPTFDQNISHMHLCHSFQIPYLSSLTVDTQTLISFLHMLVFSYMECISCGRRRGTVEGVQQHMASMGHCRVDVSGEVASFYGLGGSDDVSRGSGEVMKSDDWLRLPSGKVVGHRSRGNTSSFRNRLLERGPGENAINSASLQPSLNNNNTTQHPSHHSSAPTEIATTKQANKANNLTSRALSQMRKSDQLALQSLLESQQRAMVTAQRRELDKGKRLEGREMRRVDGVGNKVAVHTKYYKQEVPVYMGG